MVGQCHKSCLSMTLNGLKIFRNLMKTYNDESDEIDVQYLENLHSFHNDFSK